MIAGRRAYFNSKGAATLYGRTDGNHPEEVKQREAEGLPFEKLRQRTWLAGVLGKFLYIPIGHLFIAGL